MYLKGPMILVIALLVGFLGVYMYIELNPNSTQKAQEKELLSPVSIKSVFEKNLARVLEREAEKKPYDKIINVILLGIDRRSKNEGYRTDTMILLSINIEKNIIVLTSIPRDLWYHGSRINAVYIQEGWEGFQKAIFEITGQNPNYFILTDFVDFSWIIDATGGVTVDVDTTFTDMQYPVDATKTYQTVTFAQGPEKLSGERALIYARSRKGTNGEGSDWARMRRQHKILKGLVHAFYDPLSLFSKQTLEETYKVITTGRMDTNLSLTDAEYYFDLYKDKDKYIYQSLFLDSNYVFNPPMEDYGGAWVLVPINSSYASFHKALQNAIDGMPETASVPNDKTAQDIPL